MREMRLGNKWGAWAAALSTTTAVGCAAVLGIDEDYHPLGEGGAGGTGDSSSGGSGGAGGTGAIGTLGASCPEVGALACAGHAQQSRLICGSEGKWATNGTCAGDTLCDAAGVEQGTCKPVVAACAGKTPAEVVCEGTRRVKCGPDLVTIEEVESCLYACIAAACVGPSCAGLSSTCGPNDDESCCASSVVPGGTYNRSNDAMYPATVSDFRLDRFELTVGRFRAFVAAYPGSKPKVGAGAHPLIAGSGWDMAWDMNLPADQPDLAGAVKCGSNPTWTDAVGANENLPMNCITWFEAFAFCAWDGGRLPTEAEWNYAAAGGNEQRQYPWGSAPPDAAHAVYDCRGDGSGGCVSSDILKVGSTPAGDSKWGQADLGGSMWEWNLDGYEDPYSAACDNCANLKDVSVRLIRGGSWNNDVSNVSSAFRNFFAPTDRLDYVEARCARTP